MKIRCFRFQEQGSLQITEEKPNTAWLQDGVVRWLDIVYSQPTQQLREVLAPFDLDSTLLEHIQSDNRGVFVENFRHALLFRIPYPAKAEHLDPYFTVICVGETLISLHGDMLVDQEEISQRLVRLGAAETTTIPEFILYMLMLIIDMDLKFYRETRHTIDALSHSIDQHLADHLLDDIRDLINQVGRLESATEDRIILTATLLTWKSQFFALNEVRPHVQEVLNGLNQFQRWLENLEKRLRGLSQLYNFSLQETTNSRLRVLTAISAIFMPLTLIGAIYGMNFQNMPELNEPYAYFLVLGLMVFIAGGLGVWFFLRGWFK